MIGKKLGQFHCDLDPDEWKDKSMSDVESVGLITLGKKSYIDKLEGIDKDGNKHNNTYNTNIIKLA